MFETIVAAPPDPILGLTEAFRKDPNPKKVNLGVGVYKDARGQTPVLASVKEAEERLLRTEKTKNYLPIDGQPEFDSATQELLLGAGHPTIAAGCAVTAQAPGGTGALRVAGDFVASTLGKKTVWLSDPTWPNHPGVFGAAGLPTATYAYFDKQSNGVNFAGMVDALERIPEGDVVVLHSCCHNPTGVDLQPAQWATVADIVARRRLLPIVDFAYQGFADGLTEDRAGLQVLLNRCESSHGGQFLLQELRPLQRTRRGADLGCAYASPGRGRPEPHQAGRPRQLFQSARPRRCDRGGCAWRRHPAHPVGRRSGCHA